MQLRAIMLSRRQLEHTLACAIATATMTLSGCVTSGTIDMGETTSSNPTIPCDGVAARSSSEAGHTHDVCVPQSDLKNPPADGATYTTTTDDGHSHTIFLAAPQLSEIDRGEIVRVTTSNAAGHVHSFTLARPAAFAPPPSGGSSGGSAGSFGGGPY